MLILAIRNLLFKKRQIFPLHFSLEKLIDFKPKLAENYPHVRKNTLQKKNHKFDKNCERYLKISQSVPILLAPTLVHIAVINDRHW